MPNKQSLISRRRFDKSLWKACWAKKECARHKKGSWIGLNNHSVVLPTRVLANSQCHTSAINAQNSLHDQAQVRLQIRQLMRHCLTKTRQV
jgi:hypothetical protein